MKTKVLSFLIIILAFFTTSFTDKSWNKSNLDDTYLYLYCEDTEVTNSEIQFDGTTSLIPYIDGVDIIVSNGYWDIRYLTSNDAAHVGLSKVSGSSDATVEIYPDGTPGTYYLNFYLDNDLMATLTIEVE